jgi:Ni2+-binding GTPase involved in maturation of urease and hydrogenase
MVGGFLGAGKTTAMLRFGRYLADQGARVGLVTNDQSSGLADTAILESSGFAVEEITGGCFCCRFDSLIAAADRLTQRTVPEVFLAEPVGSCTDLKATVSYPLRRMYGENFAVAPFSVVLDPVRALRVLGLEPGRPFSDKVLYVYRKQLEEADILVINKIDAVEPARLERLAAALREQFPRAELFQVSARTGAGLKPWFAEVMGTDDTDGSNLAIDYDRYAEGEALLGWFNCTARLRGGPFDGNRWIADVMRDLQQRLASSGIEIAHLKMTLAPEGRDTDLAVANLVSTEATVVTPFLLQESIESGELVVNLRAEADPALLRAEALAAVQGAAGAARLACLVEHVEDFRPGRPVPTHRVVGV